jgi:hypothetical protein
MVIMNRTTLLGFFTIGMLALSSCRAIIGAEESTLVSDSGAGGGAGSAGMAGAAGQAGASPCPQGEAFCGSACVPVMKDPVNCGWCAHKCMAQPCDKGVCAPELLHKTQSGKFVTEIVADRPDGAIGAKRVYWLTDAQTVEFIRKEGLFGEAKVHVDSDPLAAGYKSLAISDGSLFFFRFTTANTWELVRADKPPQAPATKMITPLATPKPGFLGVSPDGTAFWTQTAGVGCSLSGWQSGVPGSEILYAKTLDGEPGSLVVDPPNVYFFCGTTLQRTQMGAQSPFSQVAQSEGLPFGLAVNKDNLYWLTPASVRWINKNDGVPKPFETLTQGYDNLQFLAVDAEAVYFFSSSEQAIYKAWFDGRKAIIVQNENVTGSIAVDNDYLYWGNADKVMRVRK